MRAVAPCCVVGRVVGCVFFGAFVGCAPPELCGAGQEPDLAVVGAPFVGHAHNDYEHDRPLEDALAFGFGSVEADVWWRDGDLQVSHDAFLTAGTLEGLYLAPLTAHVDAADLPPRFTLWIDLKDNTTEGKKALARQLRDLPFLSVFDDTGLVDERAVTVILTGDASAKVDLIDDVVAPRAFAIDDNDLAIDDVAEGVVVAAALNFGAYVGSGDDADRQCGCVVEKAHSIGRKVRLFGGPDTPESWQFQRDHGVDFINADDLSGFEFALLSKE